MFLLKRAASNRSARPGCSAFSCYYTLEERRFAPLPVMYPVLSNHDVAGIPRREHPSDLLPENYDPTELDICSGRGKRNWNHAANVAFRTLIQSQVEAYMAAKSKNEKTAIVINILEEMRTKGYHFLKTNKEGRWYDMGDAQARDKIGHGLRDQVTAIKREQAAGQRSHVRRPSTTLSDSGNEADHRKSEVKTAHHFVEFARRPSWIAGESSSSNEMVEGTPMMIPGPHGFETERKRSSWDFLDNFDYYVDQPHMMGDSAQGINNSVFDMSHTTAAGAAASGHRSAPINNSVFDMSATATAASQSAPIDMSVTAPARAIPEQERFQQSLVMGDDISPSDLMKNSSIMSFDPRISDTSSVFWSSGRASTGVRGAPPPPRELNMRVSSGERVSGGSTLRQATKSFRLSDMNMDLHDFESV